MRKTCTLTHQFECIQHVIKPVLLTPFPPHFFFSISLLVKVLVYKKKREQKVHCANPKKEQNQPLFPPKASFTIFGNMTKFFLIFISEMFGKILSSVRCAVEWGNGGLQKTFQILLQRQPCRKSMYQKMLFGVIAHL